MISLGLRMAVRGKKRFIEGVILDERDLKTPVEIQHVCDGTQQIAQQAREARDWLATNLSAYPAIDAIVLFDADYSSQQRISDATKVRLRLEGAILAAAQDHVSVVVVKNGRELAALAGVAGKQEILDAGAALSVQKSHAEAASAAIAAHRLAY